MMLSRSLFGMTLMLGLTCFVAAVAGKEVAPPPNTTTTVQWDGSKGELTLQYHGVAILHATVTANDTEGKSAAVKLDLKTGARDEKVEQTLAFSASEANGEATLVLTGTVTGSEEAFPAETESEAQERFPILRNSVGLSRNLRNNAVYDRRWDWVLVGPADGATRVTPQDDGESQRTFGIQCKDTSLQLVFRPRFYQKHKNLRFYEPWTYKVWEGSITGFCTWWAYKGGITQDTIDNIVAVFKKKNLVDFGYKYLQIDAGWATGTSPEGYLNWNDKFPGGPQYIVRKIKEAGMKPGIHTAVVFRPGDKIVGEMVKEHPDWFLQKPDGNVLNAGTYTLNPFNEDALDGLIRPTYKGLSEQGWDYVKIDGEGNLMAWGYSEYPEYFKKHGTTPGDALRRLNRAACEELADDIFVLGCWSVRPELVGIVDGCRLGRDGFGPAEFQYFNSYNGVVWRNDPDHCDIQPEWVKSRSLPWYMECVDKKPEVPKPDTVVGPDISDTIVRPCIVSMASGMLMLSDKMEVYEDDKNIEGIKRASPVLFSVPGQLYDYNTIESSRIVHNTTDNLERLPEPRLHLRHPQLNHAPQYGKQPTWWMLEIDRPFEHWSVLARFNWREISRHWAREDRPAEVVEFSDLGLSDQKEYLVYEFWSQTFLGKCKGSFTAPAQDPNNGLQVFAIREAREHPWIVSTTRHISQGAVSLSDVKWEANAGTLSGTSAVVVGDPYVLTVYLPEGFRLASAQAVGEKAEIANQTETATVRIVPSKTGNIPWKMKFAR
ncbi:MAG: alpha-galactosidase [Candidatus Nealsonbacteria bacterium]|nr:alpha-galactosidase [Candidatus Nealsonbacteria bacterium]